MLSLALLGCSGGGGSTPPGNTPPPPLFIESVSVDFEQFVDDIPYVRPNTDGYVIPLTDEIDSFVSLVFDFNEGNLALVQQRAAENNFKLLAVTDTSNGNNELLCLQEIELRGQGLYCIDPNSTNLHHSSAPHSRFDTNTDRGSVVVMRDTGARFLSVSTAHRCANTEKSVCSGTTGVCGQNEAYRVSDAAHSVNSYFFHFGKTDNIFLFFRR